MYQRLDRKSTPGSHLGRPVDGIPGPCGGVVSPPRHPRIDGGKRPPGPSIPPMTYKFTYARGTQLSSVLIDGASLKEALRKGYSQCQWDSVLEVSTPDNRPLQSLVAATH